MTSTSIARWSYLGLCTITTGVFGQIAPLSPPVPEVRSISVVLTAKRPDGGPIPGLAFGTRTHVGVDNAALTWSAITDEKGTVTATVRVDVRATSLALGARGPSQYPDTPGSEPRAEFRKRLRQIRQTMAVPSVVRVRIPAGAASVQAELQTVQGASAKGRLVRDDGTPLNTAIVWTEGYMADTECKSDGKFVMDGVPVGVPVWFGAGWGTRTVYRQITLAAGSSDTGDWILPSMANAKPVAVTLPVPADADAADDAVSFVREDGKEVFSFVRRASKLGVNCSNPQGLYGSKLQSPDSTPLLTPGTYYIYPDAWTDDELHTSFLKRLRAGDVPPEAITKFIVTESTQSVTGAVDLRRVETAAVQWLRPWLEVRAQPGVAAP